MTFAAMPYGYRINGPCDRERKLVDYQQAFAAYAACDNQANVDCTAYLSSFQYGEEFQARATGTGKVVQTAGYDGPCWSQYIWFDIDRPDLQLATDDVRRLCHGLVHRYGLDESELLVFFSGSKGYHVGLPTSLIGPAPAVDFHETVKQYVGVLLEQIPIEIDHAIYRKVQPLRAPNSKHQASGLYKRPVSVHELQAKPAAILKWARKPQPFEVPCESDRNQRAIDDWQLAGARLAAHSKAMRQYKTDRRELNRKTLDFIRFGAEEDGRNTRLFSAAANLAEFGCPRVLAHALLGEIARGCGLTHEETTRTINNALDRHERMTNQ